MRLESEFIRLPLKFDVDRMVEEARQFSEYEWEHHPLHYDGNTALSLVSQGGTASNATSGSMAATPALIRAPYVQQVMDSFKTIIGRSRFMRLAPKASVPQHADTEYAWRNRVRIHIPIVTDPAIIFSSVNTADGTSVDVHMAAGEAWIFDNWREHAVFNKTDVRRIHLVIDTVGTAEFWELARKGWDPTTSQKDWISTIKAVAYEAERCPELSFEQFTSVPVRSPDEIESICDELLNELELLQEKAPFTFEEIAGALKRFSEDWRGHWSLYWDKAEYIVHYNELIKEIKQKLKPKLVNVSFKTNRVAAYDVAAKWLDAAVDSSLVNKSDAKSTERHGVGDNLSLIKSTSAIPNLTQQAEFSQLTFIVAAPRAGGAMLFEALRRNNQLWSIGDAMQQELESLSGIETTLKETQSDRISSSSANKSLKLELLKALMPRLQNSSFVSYQELPPELQANKLHFLEFSPKNALRIEFLATLFPDAKFIYLHRDARENIASIIEAWESQRYVSHPDLATWQGMKWSLPLVPGWQDLNGKGVAEIAAVQWSSISNLIINDLDKLPDTNYITMSYAQLLNQPLQKMRTLCEFVGVPFGPKMRAFAEEGMPKSRYILSAPKSDKWRQREAEIRAVEGLFSETESRIKNI